MILAEVHTKCKNSLVVPCEWCEDAGGALFFVTDRSERETEGRRRDPADGDEWEPRAEPRNRGSGGGPAFGGCWERYGNLRGAPRKHKPPVVGARARALRRAPPLKRITPFYPPKESDHHANTRSP